MPNMTAFDESRSALNRNLKIIIVASILLALIFLGNALISGYILRENVVEERSRQLSNLTLVFSEHTTQTIFSAETALKSIIDVVDISRIDTQQEYEAFAKKKPQFDLLLEKTKSNPVIDVSTFVSSEGKVLNFSRSYPPPPIDLSDRDYFQYLKEHNSHETFISAPVRNKGNGKWVFYLARRLNDRHNQFIGVVIVGVSVEVFSGLYERIGQSVGQGSSLTLYRDDHVLLTRWPFVDEMLGKKNTGHVIQDSLNSQADGGVIFTKAPGFNMNNQPVDRLVSFRKVDGYPLIVGATMNKDLYLSGWYQNTGGIFYTTIISLLALVVGVYLLRKVFRKNAQNEYAANHDELTGLPNRILLNDRLSKLIQQSKRHHAIFALAYIDVDNLKDVNDNLSHILGDAYLKSVANKLSMSIRESDTVARIGGDEFVLLLSHLSCADDALKILSKVQEEIKTIEISFQGKTYTGSVSIGVSIYPDHGLNAEELLSNADQAMYRVKQDGKSGFRLAVS